MIAVLAVVLYHFGVAGLPGGFTGVDVFFVISGFLIGGILWRDLTENNTINLARFYIRRVKRLAPAYFAMAAFSAIAAWFILLPFEFREFGKELIAATTYLSNVLFWRGEGYFDIGAENKVLLHTWSLAVEEQFYIVLPFLLLAFKFTRRVLLILLAMAFLASLLASIALTPTHQTTTFYLFPFRAWELLAGVLLAIIGQTRALSWAYHATLSWLGLALIAVGILFASPNGFPGWQALLPVLGTALLLANGQHNNLLNRALASPIPVFFGKISYSLYLWHWPVLVLSKYWSDGYDTTLETVFWLALSFALATLSWAFVEQPFRRLTPRSGWRVFAGLAVTSSFALGFGALAYLKNGLPNRFGPDTRAHIAASADFLQDWSRCHRPVDGPFAGIELCPIGPDGPPKALIWGDSHVRAIKEGLEQAAHSAGTPALIIWHAGCPPLFGITKRESYATLAEDDACRVATNQLRSALPSLTSVQTLFLVGRWSYYVEGTGTGHDAQNTIEITGHGGSSNREVLSRALVKTLPELASTFPKIVVFRQPPEIPNYDSRTIARRLAHGRVSPDDAPISASLSIVQTRAARAEALFTPHLTSGEIAQIDPWPMLCSNTACSAEQNGAIWYFDNNHLNNTAARALSSLFAPLFTTGD